MLLRGHAEEIQKFASLHHARRAGREPIPVKHIEKYHKINIRIIHALTSHLRDRKKGTAIFKILGEQLAEEALKDGLTIEKIIDGTIYQKQAIWKKVEASCTLNKISSRDIHAFSQALENYYDVLVSKIAFTYHHRLTEESMRSNERFRALIEQSTDAIALVSQKGKVLYASPTTKSLMGYSPDEFLKLNNPFELVPEDDRKQVTQLFAKLLKNPGSTERAVYRVLHKNGKHIWIESTMTNLIENPNVGAVVLNYHDISLRKQLETQKDDFISIATHELKTPVTSIKAYGQILQHRFRKVGNDEAAIMLMKMDAQLNKLNGLIRDLLDATRIDAGKLQFQERIFDFNELVNDIVGEMQLTTTKHAIVKKLDSTQMVSGDRDRIGQVITNLLSNAIKYSPYDKRIIVETSTNKKEVTLSVRDFGVGIPKNKQSQVFERFFRVGDAADTFGGLGLGLFISSEIVKRHSGHMWVESSKGKGSVFCFTIPLKHHMGKKYRSMIVPRYVIQHA